MKFHCDVPESVLREVQQLASLSGEEICGMISTDHKIYPIRNVAADPLNSFVFDKREYAKTRSQIELLCIYHSHPGASPEPSSADLEFARRSGCPSLIVTAHDHRWVYAS
jgi:proteasome lid subunit RPN8/RPN11